MNFPGHSWILIAASEAVFHHVQEADFWKYVVSTMCKQNEIDSLIAVDTYGLWVNWHFQILYRCINNFFKETKRDVSGFTHVPLYYI